MQDDPFAEALPAHKKRMDRRRQAQWRARLTCGACGWTGNETTPGRDYACPRCGNLREFTGIRIGGRPGRLDRNPRFR